MKQLDLVEEHREGFAGQEEAASQGRHRLSRRIVSSTVSRRWVLRAVLTGWMRHRPTMPSADDVRSVRWSL